MQVRTAKIKIKQRDLEDTAAAETLETAYDTNPKSAFPYCLNAFFRRKEWPYELDQIEFSSNTDKRKHLSRLDANKLEPFLREWLKIILDSKTYEDRRPDIKQILESED